MSDQEETENRWKHDIIWFRSQIWYDIIIWYEISNRRWCLHNFKVALTLYHMQGGLLETLSIDFFTGKVKQIKSTVRLFDLLASKPRETQSKKKKKSGSRANVDLGRNTVSNLSWFWNRCVFSFCNFFSLIASTLKKKSGRLDCFYLFAHKMHGSIH